MSVSVYVCDVSNGETLRAVTSIVDLLQRAVLAITQAQEVTSTQMQLLGVAATTRAARRPVLPCVA